jgi:hypothetical protein
MTRTYFAHLSIAELITEARLAQKEMDRQAIAPVVYNHAKQWKAMADAEIARRRFTHRQYAIQN